MIDESRALFREPGPWKDAGRLISKKSKGQFHFAAPLSPSLSSFVSPILSLGRNKREPGPLVPQQASGSCKKSGQSFFLLSFSCRYACQKKRPPNSNSVFLLLLMPFPSLTWWAASELSRSFAFPFVDRSRSFLSLRVASTGIERQEALEKKRAATQVQYFGEASLSPVLYHDRPINVYHPSEQHSILPSKPFSIHYTQALRIQLQIRSLPAGSYVLNYEIALAGE
jgi:hypothetical protein